MSGGIPLTPDDVTDIVAILDGSSYERLEVSTGRFRLRVARDDTGWTQEWDLADASVPAATPASTPPPASVPAGLHGIHSPLPGTFYHAPQPGAAPFIEVGAAVDLETVVGIVETMKLMNPVHAGVRGTVVAIVADNAVMVEGGAILMHVAPE